MFFNFFRKKKTKTFSLLSAKSWSIIGYVEGDTSPSIGEYIYLSENNEYYIVNNVVNYYDYDGKLLERYYLVTIVDNKLVKPI